jgi:hypothetical protein
VEIAELSTPLSTRNCAAHPHGEIDGLQHTADRFEQRCRVLKHQAQTLHDAAGPPKTARA